MKTNMYSIKDIKSNVFNQPFFKNHNIQAIRDFNSLCNDENSILNKYPHDFELWSIGTYDDETGTFENQHNFILSGFLQKGKTIDELLTTDK